MSEKIGRLAVWGTVSVRIRFEKACLFIQLFSRTKLQKLVSLSLVSGFSLGQDRGVAIVPLLSAQIIDSSDNHAFPVAQDRAII